MDHSTGFPPIADASAEVLILGSLPSVKSIEAQQYYAHPRNTFWPIMGRLFAAGSSLPYTKRTDLLKRNRIAVWDVLASSIRRGSMDSEIDQATAVPNDFVSFLENHVGIRRLFFNGQKAATMFGNLVLSRHPEIDSELRCATLPSTSPAYASMSFEEKLRKWSIVSQ